MKKTSKFLSMILALAMAFALAVPAFAADIEHCDDYGKVIIKNPTAHREVLAPGSSWGYDLYEVTVGTEHIDIFYKYFDNNAGKDSMADVDGEKYFFVYRYKAKLQDDGGFAPDYADCLVEGTGEYWGAYTVENESFYWNAWVEPNDPAEELYYLYVDTCASPDPNDVVSPGFYNGFLLNIKYDHTQISAPSSTPAVKPAPGVAVALNDGTGEFAYTIKYGDSLSKIAAYYYGDVNVYKLIFERNKDVLKNANTIYAGQVITLPSYAAVAASKAPAQPEEKPAEPEKPVEPEQPAAVKPAPGVSVLLNDGTGEFAYTVKSGDSLSKIAAYYYGDVNVYKLIFERNKDTIKNANTIRVGQTIILPSYAAVAEFKAAAK